MQKSLALLAALASPLGAQQPPPTTAAGQDAARTLADAIRDGLAWLRAHQDEDGGWSASLFVRHDPKGDPCTRPGKPDQDFHVTAWATLALLGAGNTERLGPHRDVVRKSLAWLQAHMHPDGFFGEPQAGNAIAAHAIACLALTEAEGLSDRQPLAAPLQRLIALRLPDGTWPARIGATIGDADATYWAGMASLSGAEFGGARIDLEPMLQTIGRDAATTAMLPAAEAMLRLLAHHGQGDLRLLHCIDSVTEHPPQWPDAHKAGPADFFAWYVGTYALFQWGGDAWSQWWSAIEAALLPHQRTDGAHAGSWDPVDLRGKEGGRIYATASALLALAAGHRFARVRAAQPGVPRGGGRK